MENSTLTQVLVACLILLQVLDAFEVLLKKNFVSVQLLGSHVFEECSQSMQWTPTKNRVDDFTEEAPTSLRDIQGSVVVADEIKHLQVNLIIARLMNSGLP